MNLLSVSERSYKFGQLELIAIFAIPITTFFNRI
jgi:hypothetical protein